MKPTRHRAARRGAVLVVALLLAAGCAEPEAPPNVLWVVWDTVRADRLGVYGADRPTTPNVDRWADGARVFDDCLAVAPTTVPNHASMFTGRTPFEHRATNAEPRLDDALPTLAERLSAGGYHTYLWSANPHIGRAAHFTRGFDRFEHPWDLVHQKRAIALARQKVGEGAGSGLDRELDRERVNVWAVKESGTLAQAALLEWLEAQPDTQPWFAFLNYMEAHRPVEPARRFREQVMDAAQVRASYTLDRGWSTTWDYTFGLAELSPEELGVIAGVYDAALAELDDLFAQLLAGLAERGELDDTVVILSSDHGEHLGEHHMLDHQYSLYEPVLRVPLIVHFPRRLEPGREPRPVMSFDLFPTILELAGLGEPEDEAMQAVSLLAPQENRPRLAAYRAAFGAPFRSVRKRHPGFDPSPWQRRLRALTDGGYKLVWGADGRHELYHLREDPDETRDLYRVESEIARRMRDDLDARVAALEAAVREPAAPQPPLPLEDRERLEALGYGEAEPEDAAQ